MMTTIHKSNLRKFTTVLGVSLMVLPTELYLSWGNLSIYTLSYLLANGVPYSEIESPWIMSTFLMTWALVMPFGGHVASFIGRDSTLLLGACIYSASLASCYYAIDVTCTVFTFILGFFGGLGSGLTHGLLVEMALEQTDRYVGIVGAFIGSSMTIGGAITNQFVTLYTNPTYFVADWAIGPNNYFSQVEIVNRVPKTYLILGVGIAVIQFLGFCMIKWGSAEESKKSIQFESNITISNQTIVGDEDQYQASDISNKAIEDVEAEGESCKRIRIAYLRKLLSCKKFYILWLSAFVCESSVLIMFNYYKQVGRTGIEDEDWLTLIGSTSLAVLVVCRLIYGMVIDIFGIKTTYISIYSILSISSSFYVLSPLAGKWMFGVLTFVIMTVISTQDDMVSVATTSVLGQEHYTLNFGLVWTSSFIVNITGPPFVAAILNRFGWFFLFNVLAILNFIGLIIIPRCL